MRGAACGIRHAICVIPYVRAFPCVFQSVMLKIWQYNRNTDSKNKTGVCVCVCVYTEGQLLPQNRFYTL